MPEPPQMGINGITTGQPEGSHQTCPVELAIFLFCFSANGMIPHLKPSLPRKAEAQSLPQVVLGRRIHPMDNPVTAAQPSHGCQAGHGLPDPSTQPQPRAAKVTWGTPGISHMQPHQEPVGVILFPSLGGSYVFSHQSGVIQVILPSLETSSSPFSHSLVDINPQPSRSLVPLRSLSPSFKYLSTNFILFYLSLWPQSSSPANLLSYLWHTVCSLLLIRLRIMDNI